MDGLADMSDVNEEIDCNRLDGLYFILCCNIYLIRIQATNWNIQLLFKNFNQTLNNCILKR